MYGSNDTNKLCDSVGEVEVYNQSERKLQRTVAIGGVSLILLAAGLFIATIITTSFFVLEKKHAAHNSFSFTLHRTNYSSLSYFTSESSTFLKYSILDGYVAVIETHAPMELDITSSISNSLSSSTIYKFKICKTDHRSCESGSYYPSNDEKSESVTIECSPHEEFIVTVKQILSTGETQSSSGKAKCMYVRREFRSLTDEDMSSAMDAMFTLNQVSDDDGIALYGDGYVSARTLLKIHYFSSSWSDSGFSNTEYIQLIILLSCECRSCTRRRRVHAFSYSFNQHVREFCSISGSFVFTSILGFHNRKCTRYSNLRQSHVYGVNIWDFI